MGRQLDWIQKEADKHHRLLELRGVIENELRRNLPFSFSAIRVTLSMIRTQHGADAEKETRQLYNLDKVQAA